MPICPKQSCRWWGAFPRRRAVVGGRGGQAVLFVVMAIVILVFVLLWVADIHRIISLKGRSQNAGDAAALAGARWQATSLNFIGELNLMHALALAVGNAEAVDIITNTQVRLSFTGPMTGVALAQQGAKLNGVYVNEAFTEFVREHAQQVRGEYAVSVVNASALPEPWPGAWGEYADMLDAIADDGVAAGIDNAVFFDDPSAGHPLLEIEFYESIAARDWCWFYWAYPDLLEGYVDYRGWAALPEPDASAFSSSELLALRVEPQIRRLASVLARPEAHETAERLGLALPDIQNVERLETEQTWFFYVPGWWGRWTAMDDPFPVDGDVRREYDYRGADSVMRVEAGITRFTTDGGTDAEDTIVWTGAAKPFGYLAGEGTRDRPNAAQLVLPAFREVRLIPIDASSASSGGSFNLAWRRHCMEHLPRYLATGSSTVSGCRYCRNLVMWENPQFRQSGTGWLGTNSWQCTIRPPAGGPFGGTRRAH